MTPPRLVYAANRWIGVRGFDVLRENDWMPVGLLVPEGSVTEHVGDLVHACPGVPVIHASELETTEGLARLWDLKPDYLLSVHYPHILPAQALELAKIGALNLHPALLPWNRGWHTPSWAILERTPYGATLHWMAKETDAGDIALQEPLDVRPDDTADTLYARVLDLEIEVLRQAVPLMLSGTLPRVPQPSGGTFHRKRDLLDARRLDLGHTETVAHVLDRLRGLTTSVPDEAAYFEVGGVRYRVRVEIEREDS